MYTAKQDNYGWLVYFQGKICIMWSEKFSLPQIYCVYAFVYSRGSFFFMRELLLLLLAAFHTRIRRASHGKLENLLRNAAIIMPAYSIRALPTAYLTFNSHHAMLACLLATRIDTGTH